MNILGNDKYFAAMEETMGAMTSMTKEYKMLPPDEKREMRKAFAKTWREAMSHNNNSAAHALANQLSGK